MSSNYQQYAFDSQSSLGNTERWRDQTEALGSNIEDFPYNHGYSTPQAANVEYDIHVEVKPSEPIPYDRYAGESSQSKPFHRSDRVDPLQNTEPFRPYRPQDQQDTMPSYNYKADDFNLGTYDHHQGQVYQMEMGQTPNINVMRQQQHHHLVNSTESHDVAFQSYAPYQPYGSDNTLGYVMEGAQQPPPTLQNVGFGMLEQDNGSSTIPKEYQDKFGFDQRPNSLPDHGSMDAPKLEANIGFDASSQSSELQSFDLRFTRAPITRQDHSTSGYKDPTAFSGSLQMQDLTPNAQQHDTVPDLGFKNELNSDASLPLPHQKDSALAQPSPEQRARWELIRSLVKGNGHSEKEERQESRDNRESPNVPPKTNQNRPRQGSVYAPSPSKGMRTLMLPQMVERRKSIDANGEGKIFSATAKQGKAETSRHQSPPQSARGNVQNSPQSQGRQEPSASNRSLPNKPAVPSKVVPRAAAYSTTSSPNQLVGHGQNQPVPQKLSSHPLQQPLPSKTAESSGSATHSTINSRPDTTLSTINSPSNPANATLQPIRAPRGASVPTMPTPSSGQNASQLRPGQKAAPGPSQPRKPLPSAATTSPPIKASPQGQAAPHLPDSRSSPKSSSFNPATDTRPVAVAATPTSRPQAQATALSSNPSQTPATTLAASNRTTTMPPGVSPGPSSLPNSASKSPRQNIKTPTSNNRATPTGTSTATPQAPMKAGDPNQSPPATPSSSQSNPVSQSSKPLPTPQQAAPPHRSAPHRRSSVQHSSTSQQPPSQRSIPTSQPGASTIAHESPPNPTAPEPDQPPSRSKESLGRSGAVFRRTTPQQVTGASDTPPSPSIPHQDTRFRQPTNTNTRSNFSQDRQERLQDSHTAPPSDRNSDSNSDSEKENDLSEALPNMLHQLAASKNAGSAEVDLESEADNLVHRESHPPNQELNDWGKLISIQSSCTAQRLCSSRWLGQETRGLGEGCSRRSNV